jgi:putative intracellular protease/amidase
MSAKKVLVLLAPGFDEADAVITIHTLRQAGLPVSAVGLSASPVRGEFGMALSPDLPLSQLSSRPVQAAVLPGGAQGVRALRAEPRVAELLGEIIELGGYVVALGAACALVSQLGGSQEVDPSLLGHEWVMTDGHSVLGYGTGAAREAAYALAARLTRTRPFHGRTAAQPWRIAGSVSVPGGQEPAGHPIALTPTALPNPPKRHDRDDTT